MNASPLSFAPDTTFATTGSARIDRACAALIDLITRAGGEIVQCRPDVEDGDYEVWFTTADVEACVGCLFVRTRRLGRAVIEFGYMGTDVEQRWARDFLKAQGRLAEFEQLNVGAY